MKIPRKIRVVLRALIFTAVILSGVPSLSLAEGSRFQKLGVVPDPWAERQILFWKKVYTEYSSHEYLIHDSMNLARIYSRVRDEKLVPAEKKKIQESLLSIAKKNPEVVKAETLSLEERHLFEVMDAIEDPRAYRFAAESGRIRSQSGQKDRLENAYLISRRYVKRMEEMFEEEGVPKELALLPFVESSFNREAKSSVGATGIWQFMPGTAARDLRVTNAIDERYDPLKATRAAARFLRRSYGMFQNWSLAVMAYHHGPGLVQKAIRTLKTRDPLQIIRSFKDPNYRFASRNYLFEFLAMCDVDAEHELFFKPNETTVLPPYITISFPKKLTIKKVIEHYRLSEGMTRVLNPHFREAIWKSQSPIPAHYPIRLAGITLEEFRKLEYP